MEKEISFSVNLAIKKECKLAEPVGVTTPPTVHYPPRMIVN
jgi:hypothetical protein